MEEYSKELSELLKDRDYLIDQYAKEIYDLGERVLKPKFWLLKRAAWVLIGGIVVGSALIFASVLL